MKGTKEIVGVILAAGKGTRMYPFSNTLPKVMLSFWGKPLLAHHVDEFLSSQIINITIICSNENIDLIKQYFDNNYKENKIYYAIQDKPLGTAHAVESAKEYIRGKMALIRFGDNISKISLTKTILENYDGKVEGVITLKEVDNPSEFGIAAIENDAVVEIVEKPENPPTNMASMGGFLLDADILLEEIEKKGYVSLRNGKEVDMPLPKYFLDKGIKLGYAVLKDSVLDVGRPYDILSATKLFSELNSKVESQIYLGKNALIGENCTILGSCSIDGIIKNNVTIKDSYVMTGATIGDNSIISSSVIGENVIIGKNAKLESGFARVMIKGKSMDPKRAVGSFIGSGTVIKENSEIEPGRIISPDSKV